MTLTILVLIGVAVVIASVAINIGVLWLCCLIWRVKDRSLSRVVNLSLALAAISFVLYPLLFGLGGESVLFDDSAKSRLILIWGGFASLFLSWWVVKRVLKTGTWRAGGILVSSMVLGQIAMLGIAMMLRATVAEAYVVPTGAMAPTVLGQHVDVTCPNCGQEFHVDVSPFAVQSDGWPPYRDKALVNCRNCGRDNIDVGEHSLKSGDRVLVDKTNRQPQRWQLVVFYPPLQNLPYSAPSPQKVSYIKRLVGMPGEEIEIRGGDIFVNGRRLQKPPGEVQDLWLLVNDSDIKPKEAGDTPAGWTGTWQQTERGFECDPQGGRMTYAGSLADSYSYNLPEHGAWIRPQPDVDDWRITVWVESIAGEGHFGFEWRKGDEAATCTISPAGDVALVDEPYDADNPPPAQHKLRGLLPKGTKLALAVRDGRAYLMQNDATVAEIECRPEMLAPADAAEESAARDGQRLSLSVIASNCNVVLSRIQLHRDVYYRTVEEMEAGLPPYQRSRLSQPSRWYLADDEYLFLGDNSPESMDGRFFGPVKSEEIVGVVKWCYWPRDRVREFP